MRWCQRTMYEAKTTLSELVKQAQKGETVIITSGREKTPVARIIPIKPVASKRLDLWRFRDTCFLRASGSAT